MREKEDKMPCCDCFTDDDRKEKLEERQKFPMGSFVMIAEKLRESRAGLPRNKPARVGYTYYSLFGRDDKNSYGLLVRDNNGHWHSYAWYKADDLTLITNIDDINKYEEEIERNYINESNNF